jgi:small-conductance mechanosensitive channel
MGITDKLKAPMKVGDTVIYSKVKEKDVFLGKVVKITALKVAIETPNGDTTYKYQNEVIVYVNPK